jgi:Cysteine-rich secretory protein family/LysM domain
MACASGTSYTVQSGDTLYLIAQRTLGNGERWSEIRNCDGSSPNPTQLESGQELCLPGTPSRPNAQAQEILAAHNRYRAEVGVPPLQWSDDLAASAQNWANQLAATGTFRHSRSGENLAKGTSGAFSITKLVGLWGNEKRYFIRGTFPNISNSGNWGDAGHYTQMIWRNTTHVGYGLASGHGNDVLVCHYNPSGNVIGQAVY